MTMDERYAALGKWVFDEFLNDECSNDLSGAAEQDKCIELGLLIAEPYDSERHGEVLSAEYEAGETIYVRVDE